MQAAFGEKHVCTGLVCSHCSILSVCLKTHKSYLTLCKNLLRSLLVASHGLLNLQEEHVFIERLEISREILKT